MNLQKFEDAWKIVDSHTSMGDIVKSCVSGLGASFEMID
jgi:(2Fe-2S) ferredoxin